MTTIEDDEFGEISISQYSRARHIKLSVTPSGKLRATTPPMTPKFVIRRFINTSRPKLREMLKKATQNTTYEEGMRIGKSHSIIVIPGNRLRAELKQLKIIVTLPASANMKDDLVQRKVREIVIKALRIEARHYLTRRLALLAKRHGYNYERVRFSHASTRWGSCSSSGTISLNIALMKLPFELIDYVLVHELCHTEQMNHSDEFWRLVSLADPHYKYHRRIIKSHTPSI